MNPPAEQHHLAARLCAGIVDHPWRVLGTAVVVLLLTAAQLYDLRTGTPALEVDPSIRTLLPGDGPALARYETIRERFSSDDLLLVAWLGDALYTPQGLDRFKRLARAIEHMPGVEHVESLATALRTQVFEDYTAVDPYLVHVPETVERARALRDDAIKNPLYRGYLVSADGQGALIAVRFARGLSSRARIALVGRITAASARHAGDIVQFVSGPLHARLEISRLLLKDLYRVMPLAVGVTLLIAGLAFRHLRGVVLPLMANGLALAVTLALFVSTGQALNYVTVILPPTVYVVGFAYAVHVVSDFDRHLRRAVSRRDAALAALADVRLPLVLTALTTAAGFTSLVASRIESIAVFGSFAAIGTLAACVCALTVVPAGLVLLPVRARARARATAAWERRRERIADALGEFAAVRGQVSLLAGVALAALAILGALRIEVSTDYLDNFAPDSRLRQDFERLNHVFAGAVPLQIVIEGAEADVFQTPEALRAVAELATWLRAQPEVGGVYSLVDYVAELERALSPEQVDADPVPESADLVRHMILLGASEDIRRFADPAYRSTLIQVRADTVASAELNALSDRIAERLTVLPNGLQGYVTGSSYLIARTLDDVTRGQILSLSAATLPIFVVLLMMFRTLRLAFVALIPNVLPIAAFFGILGWVGVPLNLSTSLVACAVLGIAVDDSIHFFARLRAAPHVPDDETAAVRAALAAVLRPVTLTTIGLSAGFATLLSGQLRSQVEFGWLAAVTLMLAWILDLTLTPALAHRAGFDDAGADPRLSPDRDEA